MLGHKLDENLVQQLLSKAAISPRLRANHCFHEPHERLQRMVNVAMQDSYFAPHQHKDPGKLEIFTILRGEIMVLTFKDNGEIEEACCLSADKHGKGYAVQAEIPPGVWHSIVVLSPEAVMYEIIEGFYDPLTHKRFAPWAPSESNFQAASAYLKNLRQRCTPV